MEKKDQPEEWWDGEDYHAWEQRKRKRAKARGEVDSDSEDEKRKTKKKKGEQVQAQEEGVMAGNADQGHFSD